MNFEIYCEYVRRYMGLKLTAWQKQELQNIIHNPIYLMNWGRGMSKSLLLTLASVFFSLMGMRVCYAVPSVDHLDQPETYFNDNPFIDTNPYKRGYDKSYSMNSKKWYYVYGRPAIKITNIDDKGNNLSSGRFSIVIYDECALMMYFKREKELLNKGEGMQQATPHPHTIYASTPLIGSHFYTMYEKLPDRNKSWRNFENTAENFLVNTPEKLSNMIQKRTMADSMGILHAWETENLAIPRTDSGAAYKNIIEEPRDTYPVEVKSPTHVGFDFHGWKTGHIWVAFYFDYRIHGNHVFVLAEGAERYNETDSADESMEFLRESYFQAIRVKKGEAGGLINDPYCNAGAKYGLGKTNIQGAVKHDLSANILNYTIHIDRSLTPKFYEDITTAHWKDPNKFILHKEDSGSSFRNHYLDAFSNVLPIHKDSGIYIPNRQLRRANIAKEIEKARQFNYI